MKKWIRKLLSSIEDANKRNFGEVKMDCCDLNKNEKNIKNIKNDRN